MGLRKGVTYLLCILQGTLIALQILLRSPPSQPSPTQAGQNLRVATTVLAQRSLVMLNSLAVLSQLREQVSEVDVNVRVLDSLAHLHENRQGTLEVLLVLNHGDGNSLGRERVLWIKL